MGETKKLKLMESEPGYEPVEVEPRHDGPVSRATYNAVMTERDRFYGLWELEATRAVRAEGDNFLHAWDLAKVKVERDALKAALASIVAFHEEYGGALLGNTLAAARRLLAPTPGVEESPE